MSPHLRSHSTMPHFSRIAAVTGANKGIGLAIVRNLALQYPSSAFNNGPLLIYLCARDKGRGEDAVKAIESDAQLKKAKALVKDGGLTTVRYHGLDISEMKSVRDFKGFLGKEHPEGIDIVVGTFWSRCFLFGGKVGSHNTFSRTFLGLSSLFCTKPWDARRSTQDMHAFTREIVLLIHGSALG